MASCSKSHLIPQIIELYEQGVFYADMAEKLNCSDTFIKRTINKLIAEGEIVRRKKHYRTRKKLKPMKLTKCVSVPDYPELENGVYCDRATSAKCIYGFHEKQHSLYLCNYCDIKHHSRGCDPHNCTKFVEVTKDRPRLFSVFDNGYRSNKNYY